MKITLSVFGFAVLLCACASSITDSPSTHQIESTDGTGIAVHSDSIKPPVVVIVDNSKLVTLPAELVITGNRRGNEVVARAPELIDVKQTSRIPIIMRGDSAPQIIVATASTVDVGVPKTIVAQAMTSREQNPGNFGNLNKLQGLYHDGVRCILEDKIGNLWLGTLGGGVSRYNGTTFTHYTTEQGLTNNVIWSMIQDSHDNIWFGTDGGLVKYDGKKFHRYTMDNGLINNYVYAVFEDSKGQIWIGTIGGGAAMFDGNTFTHYTTKCGLPFDEVSCIAEDSKGNIWLGTLGGGLILFDGHNFELLNTEVGLPDNTIWSIKRDAGENMWLANDQGGVVKYDGKSFYQISTAQGLRSSTVYSITSDNKGTLWFGTFPDGITAYDGNKFTFYDESQGIVTDRVFAICADRHNGLWLGTFSSGLYKFNGEVISHLTDKEGLCGRDARSMFKDSKGRLWIGTDIGVSVVRNDTILTLSDKNGPLDYTVHNITEDKQGNIWFAINGGGAAKFDGSSLTFISSDDGLSENSARTVMADSEGNIWIGTIEGGVNKYDGSTLTIYTKESGMCDNMITVIFEDKQHTMWFGTFDGGVTKLQGNQFTHYDMTSGLKSNTIRDIMEDRNGNMWFGTSSGLAVCVDNKFYHITSKEGLLSKTVGALFEDDEGNIWIGCGAGINILASYQYDTFMSALFSGSVQNDAVNFRSLTYSDGLLGVGCNTGAIVQADDGDIWLGTNDRVSVFQPESNFISRDTSAPSIGLTAMKMFDENILWSQFIDNPDTAMQLSNGIALKNVQFSAINNWNQLPVDPVFSSGNNSLTFDFAGASMNQPKKTKYRFRLIGSDENWSSASEGTTASYRNLSEGSYTFSVKAMNSGGQWSEALSYQFTVLPPWWRTMWFKSLCGLFLLVSVFLLYKWRTSALRARQVQLERIVAERTEEVVHQKEIIEEKHKEITDSINYAERIQRSFLASAELLDKNFKEYFVLFQPKDVVSGDFYWATELNNGNFILATADSTGHGVPGAIMSLLNITSLEAAIKDGIQQPSEILNAARTTIISRLSKDGSKEGGKDGMDGSLISFDFKNNKVTYAAAFNPVWIVRNGELLELAPDKMPVGKHDNDHISFTQHVVELLPGDVIYTLTDGLPDQFGGPKGKKFMYRQLKELLIEISEQPLVDQKKKIADTLRNWRGSNEQVDDITLIGIRN